jgi:hypothetical protein
MFMRALGIHGDDILAALETYWLMSHRLMVRNSHPVQRGDGSPQMSSCYLVDMFEDSIDGI